jgi:hypothetical protein
MKSGGKRSRLRFTAWFSTPVATPYWFPAVCLPPGASTPLSRQWFQAGFGIAADFRVRVELVK